MTGEVDRSHLHALENRLHNETMRLRNAEAVLPSASGRRASGLRNEIDFRTREIASCEREIAAERRFLGLGDPLTIDDILSDEQLFSELLDGSDDA